MNEYCPLDRLTSNCNFVVVGENTGPNPVEWCTKCGCLRDGKEIEIPLDFKVNRG